MKISRLVLAASLVVALAACDSADLEDGSNGQGGSDGTGGAAGGQSPTESDATYGQDEGLGVSTGSDGAGGGRAPGNTSSSTGSGTSTGTGSDGCETCCDGEPVYGDASIYMRVDDSSSFASPLLTRAVVDRWDGTRPLPVRVHEFLNFYPPHVPVADTPSGFSATDGAGPIAIGARNQVFALEVAVRHQAGALPGGRTIALVVDTSNSAHAAVEQLLESVDTIFRQVGGDDAVGVYAWSPDPEARVLRAVSQVDDVDFAIDAVREEVLARLALRDPSANLAAPLRDALAEVRALAPDGTEGTVVLISDGTADVDTDTLTEVAAAADGPDRKARVLGVGVGDALYYSDDVLDRITDASGGAYVFFDGSAEARSLLGERFRELSEVAAYDVRLRIDLPPSLTLVKGDGASAEVGTTDQVIGQNIGWGGTMTFHQPIVWSGDVGTECDTLRWYVVRGRTTGAGEEHLAEGTVVVGDVFGNLHVTDSFLQSQAVVAVADALRGPTEARMSSAIDTIANVHATLEDRSLWEGSGLGELCDTVLRACGRKGFACGACDFAAPEGQVAP